MFTNKNNVYRSSNLTSFGECSVTCSGSGTIAAWQLRIERRLNGFGLNQIRWFIQITNAQFGSYHTYRCRIERDSRQFSEVLTQNRVSCLVLTTESYDLQIELIDWVRCLFQQFEQDRLQKLSHHPQSSEIRSPPENPFSESLFVDDTLTCAGRC